MTDIVERLNGSLSAGYSELRKEAAVIITRLRAKLEAAEKSDAESIAMYRRARDERDALRAKIAEMEKQEPVGVLHVGSCYGEELEDWEFEANQCACDKLNEAYVHNPTSLPLYALHGAQTQGEGK